jgi:endonuclease III related protein
VNRLEFLYERLYAAYGPQGWWPLPSRAARSRFDARGYHPGSYEEPRSAEGRFEIVMGAVLTQNTAWTNVEKALAALRAGGIRRPADVRACPPARLARLVRPSGSFNQKAKKLRGVAALFDGTVPRAVPSREALLAQWGIGPETADSILLYAFHRPVFVVDAYTRRILGRIGLAPADAGYDDLQRLFHRALPSRHELFNEYHALLVEHAKRHCRAVPSCAGCPVPSCRFRTAARGAARAAAGKNAPP